MEWWGFQGNSRWHLVPWKRSRRHVNFESGHFHIKWIGTTQWSQGPRSILVNRCMLGYPTVHQSFLVVSHFTYNRTRQSMKKPNTNERHSKSNNADKIRKCTFVFMEIKFKQNIEVHFRSFLKHRKCKNGRK